MNAMIGRYATGKEESLRKMLKEMYSLRDTILKKAENDQTFLTKPKTVVVNELDEIIDLRLEEFYSLRAG